MGGKHNVGVVLDRTNFYAEAGGQVADIGELVLVGASTDDETIAVSDTQRYAGFVLHSCTGSMMVQFLFRLCVKKNFFFIDSSCWC